MFSQASVSHSVHEGGGGRILWMVCLLLHNRDVPITEGGMPTITY